VQIQDYGQQIQSRFSLGWRTLGTSLWLAGLAVLGLALTGLAAYLTQFFAERRGQVAMRCALGARGRNLSIWASRKAGPGLAAGMAGGAALGMFASLLPPEIAPHPSRGVWVVALLPILLIWAAWTLASGWASRRAAAGPLAEYLRSE
jgi:hypothetical protein